MCQLALQLLKLTEFCNIRIMHKSSKVIALVPAYNAGEYLLPAVSSLLEQTRRPDKIIVINDGSTDGSIETLTDLVKSNQIELITNNKNIGRAQSLNSQFEILTCDYIILQDADDISLPTRVENQIAFMDAHPKIGCSSSFIEYINGSGKVIGKGVLDLVSLQRLQQYLAGDDPFGLFCPAVILRADMLRQTSLRFRGDFWPADDIDLWNRIADHGWDVLAQPNILVQYRIHGSSAVTSSFMRTRMQYEWLRSCLRSRRNGNPEPTRQEFLEDWHSVSIGMRINRYRKIQSKGLYRAAGFAYAERNWCRALTYICAATIMSPIYCISRLIAQSSSLSPRQRTSR